MFDRLDKQTGYYIGKVFKMSGRIIYAEDLGDDAFMLQIMVFNPKGSGEYLVVEYLYASYDDQKLPKVESDITFVGYFIGIRYQPPELDEEDDFTVPPFMFHIMGNKFVINR